MELTIAFQLPILRRQNNLGTTKCVLGGGNHCCFTVGIVYGTTASLSNNLSHAREIRYYINSRLDRLILLPVESIQAPECNATAKHRTKMTEDYLQRCETTIVAICLICRRIRCNVS
jgi:hypothetical protein